MPCCDAPSCMPMAACHHASSLQTWHALAAHWLQVVCGAAAARAFVGDGEGCVVPSAWEDAYEQGNLGQVRPVAL